MVEFWKLGRKTHSFPKQIREGRVTWPGALGLMLVLTFSSWLTLNKSLLLFRPQVPHLITVESGVVIFKVSSNCNSIFLPEVLDINSLLLTHHIWYHHFRLGNVMF